MYVALFIVKIRGTGKVHCNSERTGEFDMWTSHTGGIYIYPCMHTHMFWIIFMSTTMMDYTVQDYFNFNCARGLMRKIHYVWYLIIDDSHSPIIKGSLNHSYMGHSIYVGASGKNTPSYTSMGNCHVSLVHMLIFVFLLSHHHQCVLHKT